jgi:hypothetical protein
MAEGKLDVAVFVFDGLNNVIFHLSTLQKNLSIDFTDSNKYRFIIDNLTLNKGIYNIGVWVCLNGIEQDYADSNMYFEVGDDSIYENKTINTVSIIQQTFHFQVFD